MQVLWLSMNISPHLATYNLTIEITQQVHGYWVHTNIYINRLDIKLWNILGIKYVCGSFIILNEHCFNSKNPLGVILLLYFAWVEESNVNCCHWANGKLSMASNAKMKSWHSPFLFRTGQTTTTNATSKSPRFGPRPHNDNSKQGRGPRRHTEEQPAPAGGSVLGTLCHNCPQAGKPFFAQISSQKSHSSRLKWDGYI